MKPTNIKKLIFSLIAFASFSLADMDSDIRDLQLEKEKLNSEITKLNSQIVATDSMLRADDNRYQTLQERYKNDLERRKSEIDTLNAKIREVASLLQEERHKQAAAQNRSENVQSERKALASTLAALSKRLERQISQTVPWNLESRLERASSLTRDIESGSASVEEAFSRLKSLIAEEIKFGDEVSLINAPLTRKNGELINAQILRIGNQWMVYADENKTVYGILERKCTKRSEAEKGCTKFKYEWKEDLTLEERAAVKNALDVKQAKKPPQLVTLPVTINE